MTLGIWSEYLCPISLIIFLHFSLLGLRLYFSIPFKSSRLHVALK